MKSNDAQLQQMFVRATDEVIPPAPWLEAQIAGALQQRTRARRRAIDFGVPRGFGSSLRLAAGLAAILIAVATVAALLMSARLLHNPLMPAGKSTTVQTPVPIVMLPFTPSPPVRAVNWPPGVPVPAQLAGSWQPPASSELCKATLQPSSRTGQSAAISNCILHLAAYTFEIGNETPQSDNIGPPLFGNVVVNGSEIDFLSDACTANAAFGFERFTYTLTGDILVITKAQGPGQSNCGSFLWPLIAGTYTKVSAP